MVNTLPGMKENPAKQFDVMGAYIKNTFPNLKGDHIVYDKGLMAHPKVESAVVRVAKAATGGSYFETTIVLKDKYGEANRKENMFSYTVHFDKRGVCSNFFLEPKEKNKTSPFPLNFQRMMILLKRNKKALRAKMTPRNPKVAER